MGTKVITALVLIASCGLASVASAGVRVVHASPDTPAVDVYVNTAPGAGAPNIANLSFTQATDYVPLPTGNYRFRVTPNGATTPVAIDAANVAIDGNTDYTVAAIGFFSSIQPLVLVDDRTSNPAAARVRFVHAAPDVPAVDISLRNNDNSQGANLFNGVSFGSAAGEGYLNIPGGTYNLGVFLDSNGALALPVNNLTISNGFVYTVWAMGSLAQGNVQAVVTVDAIPSPGAGALLAGAGLLACRRRRRA